MTTLAAPAPNPGVTPLPRATHIANIAADAHPRFTLDGDVALEAHLALSCDRIADGLRGLLPPHKLEAVLLGGGYGRGEGGVLRTPAGDRPYNDLEFYVFMRGNRHLNERRYGRALHVLGEILTPQAGVDVEFRIASLRELAASPVSMFSYDLFSGHRQLVGRSDTLRYCAHHANAEEIPLAEATRLLMNRATGLLLAQERLPRPGFGPGDADFVARNIAKAQLAVGDALLTVLAQYHWSVRERHRRLERLVRGSVVPWQSEATRHHAVGVEFKLHPTRSEASRSALATQHAEISQLCREAWLWLEGRRLGTTFPSIRDYVGDSRDKWPESNAPRNALVNLKALGPSAVRSDWWRHPRGRVLNALAMLLWMPDAITSRPARTRLQHDLQTGAVDFPSFVQAYRTLWSKVN